VKRFGRGTTALMQSDDVPRRGSVGCSKSERKLLYNFGIHARKPGVEALSKDLLETFLSHQNVTYSDDYYLMFAPAMSIFSAAVAPSLKNWMPAKFITGCHDLVSEKLVMVSPMLAAIRHTGETSATMKWGNLRSRYRAEAENIAHCYSKRRYTY
jgi:hypothetical protein